MEDWLFQIQTFSISKSNDSGETPIVGRFVSGDFLMLGPEGLDLDPERIPCKLMAGDIELMTLEIEARFLPNLRMLSQGLRDVTARPAIPPDFGKYIENPGLYLKLDLSESEAR